MEFLKNCTTNAQAIVGSASDYFASGPTDSAQGDYEAIAYQAFSITRDADQNPPRIRDWSPSDDVRAVEAELRQSRHLVTQDASRPWLWYFEATTIEMVGQDTMKMPTLEGYRFSRTWIAQKKSDYTDEAQVNKWAL